MVIIDTGCDDKEKNCPKCEWYGVCPHSFEIIDNEIKTNDVEL